MLSKERGYLPMVRPDNIGSRFPFKYVSSGLLERKSDSSHMVLFVTNKE